MLAMDSKCASRKENMIINALRRRVVDYTHSFAVWHAVDEAWLPAPFSTSPTLAATVVQSTPSVRRRHMDAS